MRQIVARVRADTSRRATASLPPPLQRGQCTRGSAQNAQPRNGVDSGVWRSQRWHSGTFEPNSSPCAAGSGGTAAGRGPDSHSGAAISSGVRGSAHAPRCSCHKGKFRVLLPSQNSLVCNCVTPLHIREATIYENHKSCAGEDGKIALRIN